VVGFDTAASIALLAISAIAKRRSNGFSMPISSYVIILPACYLSYPAVVMLTPNIFEAFIHGRNDPRRLRGFNINVLLLLGLSFAIFSPKLECKASAASVPPLIDDLSAKGGVWRKLL